MYEYIAFAIQLYEYNMGFVVLSIAALSAIKPSPPENCSLPCSGSPPPNTTVPNVLLVWILSAPRAPATCSTSLRC